MGKLIKCFEKNKEIKDAYSGSAGSIVITWDNNTTHHNIVIEICLYAPLVAVYKYGDAPVAILDNLDICIEKLQLIKLTEDEITLLEQNNSYHFIF